jgi:hypothetical protein
MSIGVDCGTRGTKALVDDDCGRLRDRGYAGHSLTERDGGARSKARRPWGADVCVIGAGKARTPVAGASPATTTSYRRPPLRPDANSNVATLPDLSEIKAQRHE